GRDLLALRAQEIEAVGFWRVQAKHEQGAMVEPFSCLVHEERGIAKHTIVHTCMRELQRVRRKRMPVVKMLLRLDPRFLGWQVARLRKLEPLGLVERDALLRDIDEEGATALKLRVHVFQRMDDEAHR